MKKILIILSLLLTPMIAQASGVGYINYEYVYLNLPIFSTIFNILIFINSRII